MASYCKKCQHRIFILVVKDGPNEIYHMNRKKKGSKWIRELEKVCKFSIIMNDQQINCKCSTPTKLDQEVIDEYKTGPDTPPI